MRIILLFLAFYFSLFGRNISLDELKTYPKSIAKDFYIWQFLEQNSTSKEEAEIIIKEVSTLSKSITDAFKSRGGEFPEPPIISKCPVLPIEILLNDINNSIEEICVKQNLTPSRLLKLSNSQLYKIHDKYLNKHKNIALISKIFIADEITEKIIFEKPDIYLDLFVNGNSAIRKHKNINREIDPVFISKLVNDSKFEKFASNVIAFDNFIKIKNSLLKVEPSVKMGTKTLFNIAFSLLLENRETEAVRYFETVLKSKTIQYHIDQANFWIYLLTKKMDFLKQVAESYDVNIYSIYAREELKMPMHKNIITETFTQSKNNQYKFNPSNPFDWIAVKKEVNNIHKTGGNLALLEFSNLFKSEEHTGIYNFILDRVNKYKVHYFPTPYKKELLDLSAEDQALIYALARQESRFNPSSISSAYALGLMQIMPFLARDISKKLKQNLELEEMLKPAKSLEYAKYHIKTLQKEFISPLFISYAYNGGSGFTRKTLKNGKFNNNKGYAIFLDIETIAYYESKEYGKKVIANYVIYRQLLDSPVSLHSLLEDLTEPTRSDRVRKKL